MNYPAHTLSRTLATSMRPPTDLGALVASAYAAGLRLDDGYRDGTEEQVSALEQASDTAHAKVRAKLAVMGVDPAMLRAVLS